MTIHLRADRAPFRFSGPEAHKLLNDVVTGPIPAGPGPAAWWALLSPQGKILAEGLAGRHDEALWLDVPLAVADDFFRRMRMYKLRAQVSIDDLRASHRVGWSAKPAETGLVDADPRGPGMGFRVIGTAEDATGWTDDAGPYLAARIGNGVAELGGDFAPDSSFAHDIGLDQLHGIDFSKGCYVGQEVVSRMKHRGTARRRPVIVSGIAAGTAAGAPILADGRDSGAIGQVLDGKAVGIVRLDRIGPETRVTVGEQAVSLTLPHWASYRFGESATQD